MVPGILTQITNSTNKYVHNKWVKTEGEKQREETKDMSNCILTLNKEKEL